MASACERTRSLPQTLSDCRGDTLRQLPGGFAAAEHVIRHTYEVPFVSHAPLEPQNCYAWVQEDKAHVIAPTQSPSGASRSANAVTGIDRLNIKVDMARSGGAEAGVTWPC